MTLEEMCEAAYEFHILACKKRDITPMSYKEFQNEYYKMKNE